LRIIVRPSDAKGLLGLMPAHRASGPALYGLKRSAFSRRIQR
jgi:hypothetical protein